MKCLICLNTWLPASGTELKGSGACSRQYLTEGTGSLGTSLEIL